ncbi:hypothetical protein GCM10025768_05010 [Microbacterium pseudoresistens]|uniref:YtxH domain-containing protein n=1 Tax=Microbacterium pseudoresistens TaxID=640634 RepID=A0A7Y9JN97_9MICO|nr:hypothetical protein [Microbacterium pseudoresistens]NYD54338.1 hypothetical protein [Microbacterium pseudoresistens]
MKGKIGLVVGLGAGYVLGTRAGRERYEQIKTQWLKLWHLDPVQKQVGKARAFAKSQAVAVPKALWTGAVKVVKAVGDGDTPGQKVDAALASGKDAAADVKQAVEDTVDAVEDNLSTPAKSTPSKSAASSTATKSGSAKSASSTSRGGK